MRGRRDGDEDVAGVHGETFDAECVMDRAAKGDWWKFNTDKDDATS